MNVCLFSLLLARLYLAVGEPEEPSCPRRGRHGVPRLPLIRHPRLLASAATVSVLAVTALVLLLAVPAAAGARRWR